MTLLLFGCLTPVHLEAPLASAPPASGPMVRFSFADERRDPRGDPREPDLLGEVRSPLRMPRESLLPHDHLRDTMGRKIAM